jgi:hypothetical protein
MELVNARLSRTVLTAANEGDIIAAVGRVLPSSRGSKHDLELSQPRVLEGLDSHFYQYEVC